MITTRLLTLPDGRVLEYADTGAAQGRALLYCHGAPGSARDITPALAAEAERRGWRVVVPHRPGYGRSTPHATGTLRGWATDVDTLLAALGIDALCVFGYSGGGPSALALAHAFGARVQALALCASLAPDLLDAQVEPRLRPELAQVCRAARDNPDALSALLAPMVADPDQLVALFSAAMPPVDRALLATPEIAAACRGACADALCHAGAGLVHDYQRIVADWGFGLAGITCPTAVWHGDADANVAPFLGERLAAALPRATLTRLPDAGHLGLHSHWNAMLAWLGTQGG